MVEALKERWTIVIPGKWNVAIFNPEWLGKNVLESKEVLLEIGIEPGLPRRITGDNVVLISSGSSLMLAPKDLEDGTLLRMEQLACKILEILKHTPVKSVGINYGFKVSPLLAELRDKIPALLSTEFASNALTMRSREYKWSLQYEDRILNIVCKVDAEEATISFNFHTDVQDTEGAAKCIAGKVIPFRDKAKSVLEDVFELSLED